jgi:hypothetical protein
VRSREFSLIRAAAASASTIGQAVLHGKRGGWRLPAAGNRR